MAKKMEFDQKNPMSSELVKRGSRVGKSMNIGDVDIEPSTKITASEEVHHLADFDQEMLPIGNYDGAKGQSDEYRCFIYDPQLTERKYLVGYEFIPDQTEVVHHLVGYRVPKELRESADRKNFSDGQGGWSCFGGTGLGGASRNANQMITLGARTVRLNIIMGMV